MNDELKTLADIQAEIRFIGSLCLKNDLFFDEKKHKNHDTMNESKMEKSIKRACIVFDEPKNR